MFSVALPAGMAEDEMKRARSGIARHGGHDPDEYLRFDRCNMLAYSSSLLATTPRCAHYRPSFRAFLIFLLRRS